MKNYLKIMMLCTSLLLASCGTKKAIIKEGDRKQAGALSNDSSKNQSLTYVQKVYDQQVYVQNMVSTRCTSYA